MLRIWKQKPLAREINSTGRKLLTNVDKAAAQIHQSDTPRSAGGDGSVTGSGSHRGEEEEGGEEEADQDNLAAEAKEGLFVYLSKKFHLRWRSIQQNKCRKEVKFDEKLEVVAYKTSSYSIFCW